ncbi:MAG: hypothetical protein PWQ77_2015 [Kosmotogales bacterium]|nr:hypothetical protein [Kosmotogales bacterium]
MENRISPTTTKLFFVLLNICNRLNWKNPFRLPNGKLTETIGCSQNTLIKSRKHLINLGLISYRKGYKNKCGIYYINTDTGFINDDMLDKGLSESLDKGLNKKVNTQVNNRLTKGFNKGCDILKTRQEKTREEVEEVKEEEEGFHRHHHLLPHLKIIEMFKEVCEFF